jgi:hypothetical protein
MATDPTSRADDLEAILPQRFKETLTEAERRLLRAAAKGDWAICGPSSSDEDKNNDPANSQDWGRDREIRADLIRWLCTDMEVTRRIDPRGVFAYGAKVIDRLDLAYVNVSFPLSLVRCRLTADCILQYARIPLLSLRGSLIGSMDAAGVNVSGLVSLNGGFSSHGQVSLANAKIGSNLDCSRGSFKNSGGAALRAAGAKIAGHVLLSDSSTLGRVDLYGVHIGGNLECDRSSFKEPGATALNAEGADIQQSVFLRDNFSVEGEVHLLRAHIGGHLDCHHGSFKNSGGAALNATAADIKGSVFLNDKFSAVGEVVLDGVLIGGDLDCTHSSFKNSGGAALNAEAAKIAGHVLLSDSSTLGLVTLYGVHIGGNLDCERSSFKVPGGTALQAQAADIQQSVFLRDNFSVEGEVHLLSAHIGGDLDCNRGSFENAGGRAALNAEVADIKGRVLLNDRFSAVGEVNLHGVLIGGDLDCEHSSFKNSGGAALNAAGAKIAGNVLLSDSSMLGLVTLYGVHIGGILDCERSSFKVPGGTALQAQAADIQQSVFLRDNFSVEGEVHLLSAHIGGDLDCNRGSFENAGGRAALNAEVADIKGRVLLNDRFSAVGEVNLHGVLIGGDLDCEHSSFKNSGGAALNAAGAKIAGNVLLSDSSMLGLVTLYGVHIGGDLDCHHGSFKNSGGAALNATAAEIKGSVVLNDKFSAVGEVVLDGVLIGGDLDCKRGRFDTLRMSSATVKQTFSWENVWGVTKLDLRGASVGRISDDKASWPAKIELHLDGFIYGSIPGNLKDASWRLSWLGLQKEFAPQPYRQLAKVLRDLGDDDGAKQVSFELERKSHRWMLDGLFRYTIGYGIYPERAIWLMGAFAALNWVVYRRAKLAGAMAPTDKDSHAAFHTDGQPPAHYPPFNPLIYALEISVPLVKMGQDDHWQPDPTPTLHAPVPVTGRWAKLKNILLERPIPDKAISPGALRWFRLIMIIIGWGLATFFVAGLSGIIKTS